MKQWQIVIHCMSKDTMRGLFAADSMDEAIVKALEYFGVDGYCWIYAQVIGGGWNV